MNRRWGGRGLVWPVLLIAVGTVLLLNNLGLLDWSLWELGLRLWPAILLAAGVDLLIPRRSAWGTVLALLLILGIFAGSFWLLTAARPVSREVTSIDEPLAGSQSAELVLKPAVGELRLSGGAPGNTLLAGSVSPADSEWVDISRSQQAGRTILELVTRPPSGRWVIAPYTQTGWDLAASADIPLAIVAELGVGSLELDLAKLDVSKVEAKFGVGRAELRLPAAAIDVWLEGGVGDLKVVLPPGAKARIEVSRGLVALDLPPGYVLEGDIASSPVAAAGAEIRLRLNLGVGSIRIIEAEG